MRIARLAVIAGNGGVDRDWFGCCRYPRRLVPQNQRSIERGIADSSLRKPVQIRPADANSPDVHKCLAAPRRRAWLIVDAKIAGSVQAYNLHSSPRVPHPS